MPTKAIKIGKAVHIKLYRLAAKPLRSNRLGGAYQTLGITRFARFNFVVSKKSSPPLAGSLRHPAVHASLQSPCSLYLPEAESCVTMVGLCPSSERQTSSPSQAV
jgi:hypothetical protein